MLSCSTSGRRSLASGGGSCRKTVRTPRVRTAASKKDDSGRQPWDIMRFAKTVMFFNEPPKPEEVLKNLLQQPQKMISALLQGGTEEKKEVVMKVLAQGQPATSTQQVASISSREGVVLVTGATGGVGKRVVEQLLQRGESVRALVRDVPKAQELLGSLRVAAGGKLEVIGADIAQKATLLPEMFKDVRAVVSCTAVKVQPKEGDTKDRTKYYQGIKFYDPEIVGDTPETVEYLGMKNLLEALGEQLGREEGRVVLSPSSGQSQWGALDDVVMGGVSESRMEMVANAGEQEGEAAAVFRGNVSTDNFGGFASVRTKNFTPVLNLSAYEGFELRLRGNGLRYKFIIRPDTNWDGIGFSKSFDTQDGVWQTIRLPFKDFLPVFRAKTVKDGTRLNPKSVASVQLMLSKFEYDGELNPHFRAGPFQLPITEIKAYMAEPITPRFVHVSSAGVTRPNRPGINVDMEPPAVKLNDALGGILTYKLKGEDVIRESGIPFAIVRPCALTEEPGAMPVELDQGDVIKGKISRDDVADLCISLLSQPAALDTTFEIKSTVPFSQPWTGPPEETAGPRDWQPLLGSLRKGVTGKTIEGVYTGKEPEAVAVKQPVTA